MDFKNESKHKIVVFNREDFKEYVKNNGIRENEAYIEIFSGPHGKPILSSGDHWIALDFEDFPENVRFPSSYYQPTNPTITHEDAERLVKFIKENLGLDFIIHCDAGVSRSQQVAAYILMTSYDYEYDEKLSTHTHHFSQTIVLERLLRARHRTIPGFRNKDNAFIYDAEKDMWVER